METSLVIPDEIYEQYPEFQQCLDYAFLRRKTNKDGKKIPPARVAVLLANKYPGYGASVAFMYKRVGEWRANGTLAAVEKMLINQQREEIRVALDEAATEWADIIRKQIHDAKNAPRANDRLASARFVRDVVLDSILNREDSGAEEKIYIQRTSNFNPTDIA